MWKRTLNHFSLSSVSSLSHVETAHQRWLMIVLIHPFKAWNGFLFAANAKFFVIIFQQCRISNWCIVSFSFSLRCFLFCEYLPIVIWSALAPFILKNLSPYIQFTFSTLLKFLAFFTWVMVKAAVLLAIRSMKDYVKYLSLCLGLSPLPSLLRQIEPCSFN